MGKASGAREKQSNPQGGPAVESCHHPEAWGQKDRKCNWSHGDNCLGRGAVAADRNTTGGRPGITRSVKTGEHPAAPFFPSSAVVLAQSMPGLPGYQVGSRPEKGPGWVGRLDAKPCVRSCLLPSASAASY